MMVRKVFIFEGVLVLVLLLGGCSQSGGGSSTRGASDVTSESSAATSNSTDVRGEAGSVTRKTKNMSSETRDVSGFNEVELDGIGNLSIQQTGNESLTVEAEEDVIPKIRTEVVDNRLIIGPEPNTTINTTEPINYELTVKDLNALKLSGSGSIDAEGVSTDELVVSDSGAGDIKVSGRADSQNIDISGSGKYRGEDLESKEAKIDVKGSGSATLNVSDELNARVSGSGSVEYIGDPAVDQEVSGAGRVRKR